MKRMTLEDFIYRSNEIHNYKYDYSKILEYKNKKQKSIIICPTHGEFKQILGNHLHRKNGCKLCGRNIRKKLNNWENIFNKIHNYKYDYSLVDYVNIKTPIIIICPIHGEFRQTPVIHKKGSGCYSCGIKKMSNALSIKLEDYIKESNLIHNYKYDYSLIDYKNNLRNYIEIICPKHGIFSQRASYHKSGGGCPRCQNSKGEDRIEYILNSLKIKFIRNKIFESCKNKRVLPFDFYLPDYNLCIEYDGIQHYESIEIFGGDDKLKYQKLLDNIKNEWCINNNIDLLRISYKNYNDIENNLRLKIII